MRLVEDVEREARHLGGVLGPVAAALSKFDDAAAANVGVALDFLDAGAVAVNVVEDDAFSQREIAQGEVVCSEPADDRVEEHRSGHRQIGAPRIHGRRRQALFQVRAHEVLAQAVQRLGGDAQIPHVFWRLGVSPPVAAISPRLRMVPDVPMTRSKPRPTI